ncbi:MAG: 7-carboxy-7-deazaguanine synthase QueE [Steroidobacteraceae bacterium]|nr:7-carboxy-7-deazaguanine synthase QueE [Steroidobacteraceae bacterium]
MATAPALLESTPAAQPGRLRITETFLSLQGEADAVGWPTFFIRLTGCPLRCRYCDTTYSFHGGEWRDIVGLVDAARASGARHVCVTGGEPLAQPRCLDLLRQLCDAGFQVSLETSGALDVGAVDPRVSRVVDLKTPASGEQDRNRYENLDVLAPTDQLKFVLCDRADYEWARAQVRDRRLHARCPVLFSPSWGELEPAVLAGWILEDRLPVRFQVQLHKLLWGDAPGR